MKGKVKFFNNTKNFGFIAGDDGNEYFVHGSAVDGRIRDNDSVEFKTEQSDRGPRAVNVKRAEEGATTQSTTVEPELVEDDESAEDELDEESEDEDEPEDDEADEDSEDSEDEDVKE